MENRSRKEIVRAFQFVILCLRGELVHLCSGFMGAQKLGILCVGELGKEAASPSVHACPCTLD